MNWEKKQKLAELGNKNKEDFFKFCLENIKDFDAQSWMIFADQILIISDEMRKDVEFWKEMYPFLKKIDFDKGYFSYQSKVRLSLIMSICKDKLNLK